MSGTRPKKPISHDGKTEFHRNQKSLRVNNKLIFLVFYVSTVQNRAVIVYGKWSWAEEKYWKFSFMCNAIGLKLQRNYNWLKKTISHAGNLKQRAFFERERERDGVFKRRKPNFCMRNVTYYDNGLPVVKNRYFFLVWKKLSQLLYVVIKLRS